ncbi:MAG: Zn-dependent protease with chaperone function [Planctomycetota bacterium]|nr:Zn-dependent protease with chaperone function [Planctomycetota bacterium]
MATDFFDRQDAARRRTGWLVFYFVIAVILINLTVYVAFSAILIGTQKNTPSARPIPSFDPVRLAVVATVTTTVILLGSLFKILSLREGGAAVARTLGGRLVEGNTTDPAERRLLNIVEEMALASGTPVPPVYIMDDERGINAFAAGFSSGDAVIGVTRGSLHHLNRDQLQGMIAHEFSHILNGDMRLDLKLLGILHGILLLAILGQILMRMASYGGSSSRSNSSSDKKDNGAAFFLAGLALYVIGYLGVFFGRLIKSAVSRQREFLADASAVQFTRNPEGIAGALKKIGGLHEGGKIQNPGAEEACHMFFGAAVPSMTSMLATHPPLADRVKRLDPQFDGVFPVVEEDELVEVADAPRAKPRDPKGIGGLGAVLPGVNIPGGLGGAILMPAATATASVGAPRPEHVAYASSLIANLPQPIAQALREPFGASAVIYALLLDADPGIRSVQLDTLSRNAEPGLAEEAVRLEPLLDALGAEARVPMVDLALPTLRLLSDSQYSRFRANIEPLIRADKRVDLFEFALQHMLFRHLDRQFLRTPPTPVRYASIAPLRLHAATLLSSLAWVGQQDPADVLRAFQTGVARLGPEAKSMGLVPRENCPLSSVDQALNALAEATPPVKKRILDASAATIAADGRVTLEEGELLRAIADSLDCPMPPQLPTGSR